MFGFNIEESPPPNIINIPNNPGKVVLHPQEPPFSGVQSAEKSSKFSSIKKSLKILKWSLIPLSLIQLLFILPRAYPLLVTIIFPLLGLVGIIRQSHYFLKLFGIYLILLSLVQIILMAIMKGVAYIVIQTFFIIFELICAYYSLNSGLQMAGMSESDLVDLKAS
jgi:hypothetical protein